MKTEKLLQKVINIYTEMYAQATPPADFNELLENAEINELGQKVINFNDYILDAKVGDEIIRKHCRWLREYDKKQISFYVLLGCSPKYKNVE